MQGESFGFCGSRIANYCSSALTVVQAVAQEGRKTNPIQVDRVGSELLETGFLRLAVDSKVCEYS
jgi:hypothetical protein